MIRPYRPSDAAAVLAINEANQPEVGPMDAQKLLLFQEISPFFRVVEDRDDAGAEGHDETGGEPVGFLIGLTESATSYPSPNFGWFRNRHPHFAYIDRVALSEPARGQGWGPALYREFEAWARSIGEPLLCAEVNTVPPNERSTRFHQLYGFVEVARCNPYGPDEEVAMFELALD